jgi:hypothetical protein
MPRDINYNKNQQLYEVEQEDTAENALIQWKNAVSFFNEVTEPDMVEFAILRISAARKKFEYLLKKRRMRE